MKKLILTIKENWKDPVWSKVIAAAIIAFFTFLLTSFYALMEFLISKVSLNDSFTNIWVYLNKSMPIKIWMISILVVIYITLVFKPVSLLFREILFKIKKSKIVSQKNLRVGLRPASEHSTSFFYGRMASAFPGIRDITWFEDPKTAISRLEILLKEPLRFSTGNKDFESDPIWWFRGGDALFIEKFKKVGRRKVVMNVDQIKIKRIAAYHGESYYKDFVYVEVEGEKQTGLYNFKEEDIQRHVNDFGYSWEEYGLIKNRIGWKTPIRREEYDDGATVVRGKVKDLQDPELRIRYLSKYNFIIAAKGSPYNSKKFDRLSKEYLNKILRNEIEPKVFFDLLKGFNKQEQ